MAGLYSCPRPLVLYGPSGSGKSTLLRKLLEEFPDHVGFSVSHTTRQPRAGEKDGIHYHFIELEEMERAVQAGEFIESAVYSNNLYGTSKAAVQAVCQQGKICILDIDVQGVKQVRKTDLHPWYVFIKPPSLDELEQRLRRRNTETDDHLALRLNIAFQEIEYGETPGNSDLVVVNDNFEHAYQQFRDFIVSTVLMETNQNGEQ